LRPNLKTLYLSSYAAESASGRGLPKDGMGFLRKPLSPNELAAAVRAALDGGSNNRPQTAP
jgi:DNA-binding response OmpR family regulator